MDPSSFNLQQLREAVAALSAGGPLSQTIDPPREIASRHAPYPKPKRGSIRLVAIIVVLGLMAAAFYYVSTAKVLSLGMLNAPKVPETAEPEPTFAPAHAARLPEAPFAWKDVESVAPEPLRPEATRADLVQFAKDHAAFYAAQGVPEQEAMVYITNKVREVVAHQNALQVQVTAPVREPPREVVVAQPLPAPALPAAMPLVMKLTGPVPTSDSEEYEQGGRRKKVSSEGKEVEEYMKRRQNALGVSEPVPHAVPVPSTQPSFHDPGETML